MRLAACVTTRNRASELDACLRALWSSSVKPCGVAVSDDSDDEGARRRNREIAGRYPGTTLVDGPRRGVCANRNSALSAAPASDLLSFVDDDICVEPDFIANAVARYEALPAPERGRVILSGVSRDDSGGQLAGGRLTFLGHFCAADTLEAVAIHAAVFPRPFFAQERWDENIYFGYEDAELCLRALKRGYRIEHRPELRAANTRMRQSTVVKRSELALSDYELDIEAARLYVGVKRHRRLFPARARLAAFLLLYFSHMTVYLARRRALGLLAEIVRRSRWRLA